MIGLYARARYWVLEDAWVEVTYDSDATPRHAQVTVHLPAELSPDQIKRLTHVVDTCPVNRALEAGVAFDRQLVLESQACTTVHAEMVV
jgi:uncharacterized OsmC-like protein